MPSTPNLGMIEPTVGGSADVWGSLLNACLDIIDAHDHSPGKGLRVPSAGLKINADLSISFGGTRYALTDMLAADFAPTPAASVAGYSSALYVDSSDNSLRFRNSGGTNIPITQGNSLAINGVGGIGGDYISVAALFDYTSASGTYAARQEVGSAVRQYAKLQTADLQLFEFKLHPTAGVPGNSVRLQSPPALAAAYNVIFPTGVPASQVIVQMDATGQLTANNTLANNANLTLQGAGFVTAADFKLNTPQTITLDAASARDVSAVHTFGVNPNHWIIAASAGTVRYPIPMRDGDRIKAYRLYCNKGSAGTNTITARLAQANSNIGSETLLGTGNSNNANAPGFIQLTETGLAIVAAVQKSYYLIFTPGGATGDTVYHLEIDVDRP